MVAKFATGIVDTDGAPGLPRIFEKIRKDPKVIFRSFRKDGSW
jgi:hypothetical protein